MTVENTFDFSQKVALVAGGTGGIGQLIAAELIYLIEMVQHPV